MAYQRCGTHRISAHSDEVDRNSRVRIGPGGTPSFRQAFRLWLKLGFVSFGGPAGQIAVMHRELVERRRWISEDRFLHALDYCMLLPGPEAQQLATYAGWLLHRVWGGIVAGLLFILPSIFVLLGLSYLYATQGDTTMVVGVLYGVRPVVVAIVCEAVLRIRRRAIRSRWDTAVFMGAFAAVYVVGVPFPMIVLVAALCGWAASRTRTTAVEPARKEVGGHDGTSSHCTMGEDSRIALRTVPALRRSLLVVAVCASLWLIGLSLVMTVSGRTSLHVQQYTFFTKAAFVTFGGAYAVLTYVAQAAGGQFGWLTHSQTADGLALAETTPGPLIMVVQFVGFLAAWNHPVSGMASLQSAVIGAIATTFVTFLPSFMLIFVGAPYVEILRSNRKVEGALRSVTAAVMGAVLNLALVFGTAVIFPSGRSAGVDWFAAVMVIAGFTALCKLRADVLVVVLSGGLLGLLHSQFLHGSLHP